MQLAEQDCGRSHAVSAQRVRSVLAQSVLRLGAREPSFAGLQPGERIGHGRTRRDVEIRKHEPSLRRRMQRNAPLEERPGRIPCPQGRTARRARAPRSVMFPSPRPPCGPDRRPRRRRRRPRGRLPRPSTSTETCTEVAAACFTTFESASRSVGTRCSRTASGVAASTGPSNSTRGSKPNAAACFTRDREHVVADAGRRHAARVQAEDRRTDVADGAVDLVDRGIDTRRRSRGVAAGQCALQRQADCEQPLDHGVVQVARDPLAVVDEGEDFVRAHELLGRGPALGHVADHGDDVRVTARLHRAEPDLDRELLARAPAAVQVEPRAHRAGARVGRVALAVRDVARAQGIREEDLDRLPDELVDRVPEELRPPWGSRTR